MLLPWFFCGLITGAFTMSISLSCLAARLSGSSLWFPTILNISTSSGVESKFDDMGIKVYVFSAWTYCLHIEKIMTVLRIKWIWIERKINVQSFKRYFYQNDTHNTYSRWTDNTFTINVTWIHLLTDFCFDVLYFLRKKTIFL